MPNGPWWVHPVQWALWAAVMGLVMGWLGKSRLSPQAGEEPGVLRHPRSLLALGAACSGFFLLLAVLVLVFPGKDGSPKHAAAFLCFSLLGVPVIAEYLRVRHRLEDGGLRYTPLLGEPGFLRWAEVARVGYSQAAKWFRIETADGRVIRISVMLRGLPEFARVLLREVPLAFIDEETRPVLERTASGDPPSIWEG